MDATQPQPTQIQPNITQIQPNQAQIQPNLSNQDQDQDQDQSQTNSDEPEGLDYYYYTNFIGSHIHGNEPVPKSFESQNGKVSYQEIPLTYNYGSEEAPIIDSCYFECPEVLSYGGIQSECKTLPPKNEGDAPYIQEKHSMMFTFNLQDAECVACLDKWDQLHTGSAKALENYKGKVKMYSFTAEHPGELYKHPIYYKMDTNTCERVKGRNPTIWVKLNHWKNNRTLFTDLDENPIDWDLLRDVEVKMIPLIHVEKIYIGGGKASLQIKLVSAVVTDIVPINTRTRQTRTIDRLKKRKGLANNVAAQLATLRMEKQDSLDSGNLHNPQTATLPSSVGSMHQIPSSGSNVQGNQTQLNDYLGAAPAMNQSPPVQHQVSNQISNQAPNQIQLPSAHVPTQVQLPSAQLQAQAQPVPVPVQTHVPQQIQFNNEAQEDSVQTVLQIQ